MIARPALRYHGGKWRLSSWLTHYFPPHTCYVDLYGGGASVLLQKTRAQQEVYNDAGRQVVNFFRVLRDQPDELIRLLELTPYSRAEFDEAKARRREDPADSPLEAARRFFVLSWQGRGGPMARWNTGWRFQSKHNEGASVAGDFARIEHLYEVAARLRGVQIECDDALKVLARFDTPDTLFYCDPPYLPETRSKWGRKNGNAYEVEPGEEHHAHLAAALRSIKGMALVSGYPSQRYDELFDGWEYVETTSRTDGGREGAGIATEGLWISPRASALRLPLFAPPPQKRSS